MPATSDAPFTATFTFSEAVTGFAVGDITLGNATASSFTVTSTTVYTALVTPTADGAVTVDVPANAAQDADGNGNTAATRASSTYAVYAITIVAGTSPVTEGTSAVFTLSRTGSPAAALAVNVTVSETGGDMVEASNEGDQTVTFLANAATATLSVATLPDGVDQANSVVTATISADTGSPASYSVGTPASAMVNVEDNDTRGVTVSTTALTVNEGLPGSYTVVLDSQPTANVTVTPSRTGSSDVTFSPPTLTFTTRNWNTVQPVTVTAAQDSDAVDDSATISHAVTGGDYVGVTVDSVVVTVDDDDTVETAAELDRAALVALYDNAGGDGWYLTTNWKTSQPLSAWFGVTTDSDGRVTVLHLNSINMVGTLPTQLGNLTALEQLDLAASPQLTGQIPDLSGLTALQQLSMWDNQLTGEIPDWLGSLTALTLVALSGNQLEGAIPDLSNLSSLETLNLGGNQLTGAIPDLLGSLTALEFLNLSGNELTGAIPDSLGSLTALEFLYLSHNELTGAIPDSLGSLTALELLRLSHNELTGAIPDSLGSLTALEFLLDLSHNELTGAIPDSLGSLTSLKFLDLSHNELTGAIPDLSNLTSLERLYLDENQLMGEIPTWLDDLTALRRLSLAGNQLTGEMPDSLDNIISLQLLNLNNNLLTGAVLNFRSSNGLKRTRFANNALTGCVPHSLRDLVDASSFTYGITQDFIAVDANEDGDTDDEGDVPGLNLPFCMLSGLTLSGLDLDPAFASGTMTYTAEGTGTSTTVTAIRYESSDQLSVRKGTTSYSEGDAIPLDVGSNVLEIEVTPTDQRLLKQTHTVDIVVSLPGDTTAPRVASIVRETPTSSPTNADSLTWRVTFSEVVSNVDAADFEVSGTTATVTAVAAVSGTTAAYDVTASGGNLASVSATVTLTISSSHNIEDGASNDLSNTAPTGTNDNSYVLDNAAPIVTISGLPSASNAPFTATFTFSEAVTGFAMGDITLTNASASNFTATSTTVYTALVTPTASGTVTVDVPANAAQDAVGNGNTAATRASSTYAPPAITIVAGTSPVTEGTSAVFTLSRAGSTTAALTVNVTVSETGGDMVAASNEGDQTVTFLANAATATLSVTTASDSVDEANSVVTATISADTGSPVSYSVGTPSSAMVTVEDNDTRDVTVSTTALTVNEGTTGTYTVVLGSQPTASVTVTPSRTGSSDVTFSPATLTFTTSTWNTVQEVTVTVAQDSDAVNDSATISHAVTGGDYAGVTVESVVVTVDDDETADTTAPRVASIVREAPTSSPTNADSLTWRVTFSETVLNVDAADFAVSGTTATVTAVAAVSGVTGAYDVTASGGDLASVSATVTLAISSSHNIRDGASNALSNTAPTGTNDNSYVVDNTAPTVAISGLPSASDAPFTATFTFSEAVTGFAVGDITLTNASVSSFTVTSTTVYTALVTPTASGTVTVDVSANAAQDAVGNGNTAATRASSTYAPPAITIVAGTSPVTEGTSAVFTLSRAGSTTAALTVNVTVSETGGDMVAASNEGDQTVTFLANAATATLSVTTRPDNVDEANSVVTATISADTGSPAGYSVGTPSSAMVTVEDNDTRDVTVSTTALTVNEGTTGTYTVVLGSQPTASVTVTPSRTGSSDVTFSPATLTFTTSTWNTVQEVTVTVAQDSDAVNDSATISHAVTGGDYAGVTVESVVVTVDDDETADTTAPRVASIVREAPTSSPTNADSLTWRVTFSETVLNVDAADFAVSGTTATVTAVAAVSGVTGAYDVTASGGDLASVSATVTLAISSSHNIRDGASNALSNTAPTGTNDNSYVVDNTAPTVAISGLPSASDAPFTATFTFSEAVTGFAVGDITLTNASVSSFTVTSTTVYTALVTPTASGTVTVDVPANAAQDAAGNGNTAAPRASSTYTGTAALPAITIAAGASPVTEGTSAVFTLSRTGSTTAALTVNVTVSEAGGDMVAASNEGDRTVTFLANSTTVTLSIATVSDSVAEANSVVTATISADTGSPASYSVGAPGSAMVTVRDDDSNITVPGAPTALSATAAGGTQINLSWTAPTDDGGSPIIGYKIEVSPDGNADWTELVANTGNANTTYEHIGLTVGTSRHYRVSAINSDGVGDPSNIDDATASVPTVTLRTQSVPESIGTAMLVVTLDQPAGNPLSVPWYTLSSTAASPGDYTNGAGTLIIPSGVTNATISITIIDDAVEEPTETVLVLLSPGDGYDLGGSGATVSILDDDGDGPAPSGATVDGATVVLTYNEPLDGASTPSSTAFVLRVAGDPVSINEVSVDGSEVTLTLAAPVPAGQTVSLDHTQPMSNPIQDGSGNKAQSFARWYLVTESTITITNPVITVPGAPTALSATAGGNTQINLSWTAPGENGGAPISGYKIESSPDGVANWTELVANTGNANTTYEHLGLTVGTTRHYRVSAINSEGAGDPSNIDDATAIIPTVTLRTQTVLESIGTAALLVTLNQPAGDPLSVPWSTLSVEAVPPGDYTARGGTLIIPPEDDQCDYFHHHHQRCRRGANRDLPGPAESWRGLCTWWLRGHGEHPGRRRRRPGANPGDGERHNGGADVQQAPRRRLNAVLDRLRPARGGKPCLHQRGQR